MEWFDEQIRQRTRHDDEVFSDALTDMAGVVIGERVTRALNNDRIRTKSAIDEILRFYHVKPLELPENIEDINDQLEYLTRPSGIMRRVVNLSGDWYNDAVGAMIGSLKEDGSVVALIPGAVSGYMFYHPKLGKRVKLNKKTAALLNMEAICFYRPLPTKKIGIRDLLVYIVQTLPTSAFVRLALITLAASLIGLLIPRIYGIIYGHVILDKSPQLFMSVFGFLLCVSLSKMLVEVTQSLAIGSIGGRMCVQVQAAGMMRLLSLPANFFKEYSSGDLASRMSYISNICNILLRSVLSVGLTSLFSLIYIGQMIQYAPDLVIPGLLVILFTVIFSVATTFLQLSISKKTMELNAKEEGLNYALITGVQKIKLAGAEKRAFAKWANAYKGVAKLLYDPPTLLKISGVITTCIGLVGSIVIYYFTIQSGILLADYYAFNASYGIVMGAFTSLVGVASSFAQIKPMLTMIRPVLETVPEISENKKVVTRLSGGIELNNVSFRYSENAPMIIDDLSLKIRPGQYVAIVGKTGCGKSTLMRLMLGFEIPQKGAVYYDGKDISEMDLKSLRRNIGTVMQNGKLFQGDVYSNITISAPWLTLKDAWEAAETAGIANDIRSMPMEMHTIVSEGGGGISGGQKQRLMIARAIAPKPKILMFDEATSALDNITQRNVSEALDGLKCTRLVIAHRLSTIKHCDRIIVLEGGKIVEDGTFDELLKKNGKFAELVARQRLDGSDTNDGSVKG